MAIHAAWGLAMLLGLACPALAGDCRLALVLALDVSGSVNKAEDRFQREGLAHALLAPEVTRAFLAGEPVALYVFQWAGEDFQVTLGPGWQMIRSEEDLARVAAAIVATEETPSGSWPPPTATALGAALGHAAWAMSDAPACQAKTVDVAGDGVNNYGIAPQDIYRSGRLDGVTVNALIIGALQRAGGVPAASQDTVLVAWFEAEVLHGPKAFWILVEGYADYERAMRTKLLRELELPVMSGLPLAEGGT